MKPIAVATIPPTELAVWIRARDSCFCGVESVDNLLDRRSLNMRPAIRTTVGAIHGPIIVAIET